MEPKFDPATGRRDTSGCTTQALASKRLGTLAMASAVAALLAACGGDVPEMASPKMTASAAPPATKARAQAAAAAVAPRYNYAEVLQKSIFFYEAQQSGKLPEWNRVSWRGDSRLTDGADVGKDLTGGWYDAGDHIKFGFPMASTATVLAWGVLEFEAGYKNSSQYDAMLRNLRFVNDYFLKAHTAPNEFYGQVGNGSIDHSWWGPVEVYPKEAPSYKIDATCGGSDLAAETAASMAAASMIFKTSDAAYADKLLTHAKQLFSFADTVRGKYSDCIKDAQGFYNSWSGYADELAWGATWLYKATGDKAYLTKAESFVNTGAAGFGTEGQGPYMPYKWTHDWDNKHYGTYILLARATGKALYRDQIERNLTYWTTGDANGDRARRTPGGLAWIAQWGPLRYALDQSFISLVYAKDVPDASKRQAYRDFAMSQLHYALGDNPRKSSYVIGFGANWPKHPHHRTAHGSYADSMSLPSDHRHTLYGALVGGPGSDDSYTDSITDYISNEVATDYNSGFTGVVAAANELFPGSAPLADFPQKEVPTEDEYFVEAGINVGGNHFTEIRAMLNNRSGWPAKKGEKLSLRYFVDLSEVIAAGVDPSAIKVVSNYSQGGVIKGLFRCGVSSIYYAVGDFTGTNIFPGGQSAYRKEMQFRIAAPEGATYWNPANDPSYKGMTTAIVKTPIIAVYDNGRKVFGLEPAACGGDAIAAPATPANVSAAAGNGQIGLSWAASTGATRYSVKRSSTGAAGSFSSLANTTLTTYVDSGLPDAATFYYVVSAGNDGGDSADSAVVSAKTPTLPPAAAVVQATAGDAQVSLSWGAAKGAATYDLERSTTQAGPFAVVKTGLTSTAVTDIGLTNGTTYYYRVIARNAAGSAVSAVVSATPNKQVVLPTAPVASATAGDAKVSVSWNSATNATGYQVQRSIGSSTTFTTLSTVAGTVLSYVDAAVTNGTTYNYRVVATNANGSAASTVVSATPQPVVVNSACTLTLDTSNTWAGGQVLSVVLANSGANALQNWSISFTEPSDVTVTNSWNMTVSKAGRVFTLTPAAWNATINPKSQVDAGMQLSFSGAKPVPSAASVAGQNCKVVVR